ncbi:MAG TPA: NnrS family protein [Usitatibacter sp.]|nr:NnrS family protein [Usitatibacter sp.]
MKRLLDAPHRLFFFSAVVQLLLASAWWAATLMLRAQGSPPPAASGLDPVRMHAFLMVYGFFAYFVFGFLFTAGPRWLEVPGPTRREYVPAGIAMGLAGALLYPALAAGRPFVAACAALMAVAWLFNAARFWRLVAKSAATDRLHAKLAAAAVTAGGIGVLVFATGIATESDRLLRVSQSIGVWAFLVPLFCTVCHRMLPFFTANALPFVKAWRPGWLLAALYAGSLAHGTIDALECPQWLWIVDVPLAITGFSISRRWGVAKTLGNRLLAMLHIGFLWIGIAFALHAVQSMLLLAGVHALGLAPVHAFTIGFLASVTLAMVSRVSCGHSGRMLAADRLTWYAFLLLQTAAALRVAADLWPAHYGALLLAAAGCWLACFGPWACRYLPLYWRPRADGRPG